MAALRAATQFLCPRLGDSYRMPKPSKGLIPKLKMATPFLVLVLNLAVTSGGNQMRLKHLKKVSLQGAEKSIYRFWIV
ncbi:hypothetical protein Pse7429DRAFT_1631 [Pseudanabaena biceps PCC 7429]|uniref:Uncharacterized protein n=1 Tax=Pseudanabaena biceps PCC 7429 TaxID=927668 RepID=L8MYL4_9CYAN|nr:hypothetical protein Pse7429DRAFT_1631 [Pseudanabaena biceps PCC 7429]